MTRIYTRMTRIGIPLLAVLFTAQACNFLFGELGGEQGSGARGVFRSADSAATWEAASSGGKGENFSSTQVSRLFVEAANPANLLAATLSNGLLASDKGGDGWLVLLPGVAVYDTLISAGRPQEMFASGARDRVAAIYKSPDRGSTWMPVYSGSAGNTAVTVLRQDGNALYAGLSTGAFLRSTDHGASWEVLQNFKNRVVDAALAGQKIFALTRESGLRRTEDGGASWTQNKINDQIGAYYAVAVDPKNSAVVYAGTDRGLYQSRDSGGSWSLLQLPVSADGNPVTAVVVNPQVSAQIFAAIRWTVYRSDDGGGSWRTVALPTRRIISDIAINPIEPNKVYVGFK